MPSREPVVHDRIPETDIPRAALLDLAESFGIRDDVAAALREKEAAGKFGLRTMTLSRVLCIARAGRTRIDVARASGVVPSMITAFETGDSKNMRLDTTFKLARGYRLPWLILICAALREYGFLSAPGAKQIPRNRTRVRKSD